MYITTSKRFLNHKKRKWTHFGKKVLLQGTGNIILHHLPVFYDRISFCQLSPIYNIWWKMHLLYLHYSTKNIYTIRQNVFTKRWRTNKNLHPRNVCICFRIIHLRTIMWTKLDKRRIRLCSFLETDVIFHAYICMHLCLSAKATLNNSFDFLTSISDDIPLIYEFDWAFL